MDTDGFECQKCGGCCKHLILEVIELDVVREPRLLEFAELFRSPMDELTKPPPDEYESHWDRQYILPSPCPFLKEKQCSIYPTRPNMCVAFEAGIDERCVFVNCTSKTEGQGK